jgi:cholesterol oxidase
MSQDVDYDVIVIGSGFGGSVSALRLTEKGYRVGVLEAGRRFDESSFPKNSWHVRDYLHAPRLGLRGMLRITLLGKLLVFSAAGVGGGSLVYANTLYEPPRSFYDDPQWRHITDWRAELAPHYDQARRMLGVTTNPLTTPSDEVLRTVARDVGVGSTYRRTPVGVFFGAPGESVDDPFFGGLGPRRSGCLHCGECMTGCRHNAKNTLPKNYLHLAEHAGAVVHPETEVTAVRPLREGYAVVTRRRTFTAGQVVFAASALGTQRLLHRMRDSGVLPRISPRLGTLTRTNSEALLAARSRRRGADFSRGVAITSSIHPDPHTHVEPVRYGRGSNLLGLLGAVLVDGDRRPRWLHGLREMWRQRRDLIALHDPRRWSQQTIVLLVMQSLDNSVTTRLRRGRLVAAAGVGEPSPTWIPVGHDIARRVADVIDGVPGGTSADLVNVPSTGHLIGGCVVGDTPETGVVDPYQRLFGHPGLHVIDGSAISANLGVNPSLTITAQAERATSLWPNAGDADPRPPLGAPYARVAPVAPRSPVVPSSAPGALRLPITPV